MKKREILKEDQAANDPGMLNTKNRHKKRKKCKRKKVVQFDNCKRYQSLPKCTALGSSCRSVDIQLECSRMARENSKGQDNVGAGDNNERHTGEKVDFNVVEEGVNTAQKKITD